EPLDGLGNVQAATATGAPLLHDGVEANVAGRTQRGFGDIEAAFSSDATVVHQTFRFGRVIGGYMEPRASAASLDEAGRVVVQTSTQWVYGVRDRISQVLGIEKDQVRVMAPDVGGGFGAKGQ